jgi:hypothetical protein
MLLHTDKRSHQRRLAAAARPNQPRDPPRRQPKRNAVHDLSATAAHPQIACLNRLAGHKIHHLMKS